MGVMSMSSIYLMKDGTVKVTGKNDYGQLGLGNTNITFKIYDNPNIDNIKQVASGQNYTMFLKNDGTVWATGFNTGQFSTTNVNVPTKVNIENVKGITCGHDFTIFLLKDGTAKGIGKNDYGQLGTGDTKSANGTPFTCIPKDIKQVSCGQYHTMFLLKDGTVYSCGGNNNGQTGLLTPNPLLTPSKVNISDIKQISCGFAHTLFLLNDGSVMGCGTSNYYQLGKSGTTKESLFKLDLPKKVIQVACGSNHSVVLFEDGTVATFGNGAYGVLGNGGTANASLYNFPITNVKEIYCGAYNTKVLTNDDKLFVCGRSSDGELGSVEAGNNDSYVTSPIEIKLPDLKTLNEYVTFDMEIVNNTETMVKKTLDNKLEINIRLELFSEKIVSYKIEELSMDKPIYTTETDITDFPYDFKDTISLNTLKDGINKLKVTFVSEGDNVGELLIYVFKGKDYYSVFNKAVILKDLKNIKINKMVLNYKGSGKIFPFIKESNSLNYEFINNKELKALLKDSENTKIGFIMDKDAELNSYGIAWI